MGKFYRCRVCEREFPDTKSWVGHKRVPCNSSSNNEKIDLMHSLPMGWSKTKKRSTGIIIIEEEEIHDQIDHDHEAAAATTATAAASSMNDIINNARRNFLLYMAKAAVVDILSVPLTTNAAANITNADEKNKNDHKSTPAERRKRVDDARISTCEGGREILWCSCCDLVLDDEDRFAYHLAAHHKKKLELEALNSTQELSAIRDLMYSAGLDYLSSGSTAS